MDSERVGIEGPVLLERVVRVTDGRSHERFRLAASVIVRHPTLGRFEIPAGDEGLETDLTSVPAVFGWLIGTTGAHLPAAVVHDALLASLDDPRGPARERRTADLVFGDLLRLSGVGPLRRGLMLAAVTLATRLVSGRSAAAGLICHLLTIVVAGVWATLGLIGVVADPPWMVGGGASRWLSAVAGVVVIPVPLALLWGRDRRHGLIAGWSLAALLHVSAVIAALLLVADRADRIGLALEARQSPAGGSLSPSAGAVPASSTADGGTKPSTALNANRRLPSRSGSSSTSTTTI